ncbi:MAG TPA: hypothetical protein VNH18_27285 [Bryobacteraceae bacterium]|nr:hypothetical protein [Bryobacteraceae bacterium]
MRSFRGTPAILTLVTGATLCAAIIPTLHFDAPTSKAFDDYIAAFEKDAPARFASTGKLWIDRQCCGSGHSSFDEGKPVIEPRENKDVANGSIHHFSGTLRVPGGTIDAIQKVMSDYPNYLKYFKGDLGSASGVKQPDSKPDDLHFLSNLSLVQTTVWMNVTYDTVYDTHYRRLDKNRWSAISKSVGIKELRDPKNASAGTYPEGDDHGFLWRTNTYWMVRERDGGLDMEVDSISVSRPIPTGFGWWGTKRTKDAVDKMLHDTKAAMETLKWRGLSANDQASSEGSNKP